MELDLQNWMFAFVRASAFLLVLPVFSAASVPVTVRVLLAAMLGLLVGSGLPPSPALPGFFSATGRLIAEAVIGLTLGFTTRLVFGAFEVAGQLISSEIGLNMSSVLNPISTAPTQAPGMILFLLATVLMFALDLHHWLIAGFVKSYSVLPVGGMHMKEIVLEHMVKQTANMFVVAVQMAAPIMAVSFIVTLVFSVLGRAVPQMNVFSESFALRITAGLTVFALTLPLIAEHMINSLRRMPEDLLRVAQWMGAV
ncbi:MAG TPA: flagellar biosynthetic protein FliR [Candidatus Acidoferrum sp.]|nr:flagellar biosynthetic protein FliR [Candidatus Acidoferrum sp.]